MLAALLAVGCTVPARSAPASTAASATGAAPASGSTTSAPASDPPAASPVASATPTPISSPERGTITLAFAGDANAFQAAGQATTRGLGEAGKLLSAADWAMVNLETALADDATGLTKQPKLYTFLTGSAFPAMLQREGVDLVSLANNHAMDFGVAGMERTLAIKARSSLPMVGVGRTEADAFAPWTGTVKGRSLAVFVGNDILESNMDWRATAGKPGVAMIKTAAGLDRLVASVTAARQADPSQVIVVYVHWGEDYQVCTSTRQRDIAQRLAAAGATLVVGTHAHRVQRITTVGSTLVAYGLGNFVFDSDRVETRETGVLTVTIPASGQPSYRWAPGVIRDGQPVLLTGDQATAASDRITGLTC